MPFHVANEGERITGDFTGTTQLVSGKYALIENASEFTLVPWRPVMDERLGRQISGVVRKVRARAAKVRLCSTRGNLVIS